MKFVRFRKIVKINTIELRNKFIHSEIINK